MESFAISVAKSGVCFIPLSQSFKSQQVLFWTSWGQSFDTEVSDVTAAKIWIWLIWMQGYLFADDMKAMMTQHIMA